VVLRSEGQRVFGVVHRPGGAAAAPGVLILHGLVGSKEGPHQLYVKLGEELANAGVLALRIDLRGRGDSEGNTVDVTPGADLADARAALHWLGAQPDVDAGRLGIVGHSWGGSLAACLAGRDDRLGPVALWNASFATLDWNPPTVEVGGRRVVEVWGNLLGEGFYAGARALRPLEGLRRARGPLLVLQSGDDEVISPDAARAFREALEGAGVAHDWEDVPGADHAFMSFAAEQEALRRTTRWLRRALSVGS
jgi:dienelactone hydrolase